MSAQPVPAPSESAPENVVRKPKTSADSSDGPSRAWQLATLLLPIVLTTGLGYWVGQKEDKLKQDIDNQSQLFSQQLQLSEELYKRRFDSYETLYKQLVELHGKLQPGLEPGQSTPSTFDEAVALNQLLDSNRLHMSKPVEQLMGEAWIAAARGSGPQLSNRIEDMEDTIKSELDDWMLAKKEALQPTASPASAQKKTAKPKIRSAQ